MMCGIGGCLETAALLSLRLLIKEGKKTEME